MAKDKICILIVDDAPENIDILRSILGDQYKLKVALNGEKALEIAKGTPKPDLILLDVIMPGIDGYEVCKILKSNPETKGISIIFQTSKSAPLDEQRAFELGATDYITKPFVPEVVKSRINTRISLLEEKKNLNLKIKTLEDLKIVLKSEDEIEQLISTGETDKIEFKSTLRHNLYTKKNEPLIENQCLKTVVGFLNGQGGYLFVGVDDNGNPIGLNPDGFKNNDKLLLHWFNLLKETIETDLIQHIESDIVHFKGEQIFIIGCKPSNRPVFFNRNGEEHFYLRVGNKTQSLRPREMLIYIDNRYGTER